MKLVIRPAAAGDLENAFLRYEQHRIGLGDAFLAAAGSVFGKILSNPELYLAIHRQTRQALLRRSRYCVYSRAYPEVVVIVACMHGRRDPAECRVRA